jgi:DNA-binding LytR/AlgR family response regulator
MINCIALDDEPLALELITQFCASHEAFNLWKTFTNIDEAQKFMLEHEVDLLFLDIQMPDGNGIEFYNKYCADKLVIFTTAYSHYAVKGFELQAVDYLMKPFNKVRFDQAMDKALRIVEKRRQTAEPEKKFVTIKSEYRLLNLWPEQVLYVASKDDYVKIYMPDGKFVMSKMTTAMMQEKLNFPQFVRIHRSFIINASFVTKVNANSVLIGDIELPIGKKYKKEVLEKWHAMS